MPTDPATPRRGHRRTPRPNHQRPTNPPPGSETITQPRHGSPESTSTHADVVNLADIRTGHTSRTPGQAQTSRTQAPGRRSRARTGHRGVPPAPPHGPATSTAGTADADTDEVAERAATIARIVATMGELTPEDRHRLALLLPAPRRHAA